MHLNQSANPPKPIHQAPVWALCMSVGNEPPQATAKVSLQLSWPLGSVGCVAHRSLQHHAELVTPGSVCESGLPGHGWLLITPSYLVCKLSSS